MTVHHRYALVELSDNIVENIFEAHTLTLVT